ncbi:MAG: outer membrane protein transport protein [Defluviicoccus sp.]
MMITRTPRACAVGLLVLSAIVSAEHAAAGGFYLSQQGTAQVGRGGAGGAAIGGDASVIYTNPAALTTLARPEVSLGGSVLMPRVDFENDGSSATAPGSGGAPAAIGGSEGGNPYDPTLVPNFYLAYPVPGDRLWLGVGVSTPFGIGVKFPKGWFGRYDAIRSSLTTVDIAPTLAVKINKYVSVGGGVDIQYADAYQTAAVPNPFAPGGPAVAADGRSKLEGEDWSVGFNAGVLITLAPTTRVGLHYRSGITQDLDGEQTINGLTGPLAGGNGRFSAQAELDLPDIVTLAAAHELTPGLTLFGEFQWFNWSRYEEIRGEFADGRTDVVLPQNYRDSIAAVIGAEYAVSSDLTLRCGFRFETTPTRDQYRTTTVPDADNYSLGAGLTYTLFESVMLDVGVFGTLWDDTEIERTNTFFAGTPAETNTTVKARAESRSVTAAIGLRYLF